MYQNRRRDWREVCKAAVNETDSHKLMILIGELTRALDERDQNLSVYNSIEEHNRTT